MDTVSTLFVESKNGGTIRARFSTVFGHNFRGQTHTFFGPRILVLGEQTGMLGSHRNSTAAGPMKQKYSSIGSPPSGAAAVVNFCACGCVDVLHAVMVCKHPSREETRQSL